jgi:hypothetical protein
MSSSDAYQDEVLSMHLLVRTNTGLLRQARCRYVKCHGNVMSINWKELLCDPDGRKRGTCKDYISCIERRSQ